MKPTWNGAVSFGLVTIPVALVPATEDHSISFRQIHTTDGGRVRYSKRCELDGQELGQADIGRAYETATGTLVEVTDADLDGMPLPTAKTIDIVCFVPAASIDPIAVGTPYYLMASGPASAKPYVLLRMALERSSKVAVAKVALRGRERLALLRVVGDALCLHIMLWPDELRSTDGVSTPPADVNLPEEEVQAAIALTEALSGRPMEDLHDEYREALEAVIAAKAGGGRAQPPEPAEAPSGQVVDLMAALEKSVQDAKAARGEHGQEDATVHEIKTDAPAKKKTAAKKTAARARKTSPRSA
ncbi:Ku protein (plasmid) [Streptomyces sp. DSM 116496]|uniref:non-homologous end joining protein Ku n=1 Tax=Streptomyces stoeckheimensis TaxID=3344656 RepID=UPI0038B2CAD7